MSTATKVTDAAQRATIAASMIRRNCNLGRSFDDCFEMGDGDEVLKILAIKAQNDWCLAARLVEIFNVRFSPEGLIIKDIIVIALDNPHYAMVKAALGTYNKLGEIK
jgi:hypothetical protein